VEIGAEKEKSRAIKKKKPVPDQWIPREELGKMEDDNVDSSNLVWKEGGAEAEKVKNKEKPRIAERNQRDQDLSLIRSALAPLSFRAKPGNI